MNAYGNPTHETATRRVDDSHMQPDNAAAALARRRWDRPEVIRARVDAIERQMRQLAAKRRELLAKLPGTPDSTT